MIKHFLEIFNYDRTNIFIFLILSVPLLLL
nr:MAG TPA: hypothetical protein [Caudoviricetes sp.]